MRIKPRWHQSIPIPILTALAVGLVYFSRDFGPFAAALTRYSLFVPVIYAAHLYGVSGGIAASLGLSTLLVPLVVGRALASGAETPMPSCNRPPPTGGNHRQDRGKPEEAQGVAGLDFYSSPWFYRPVHHTSAERGKPLCPNQAVRAD